MGKLKTKKSAAKRFKITGTGKVQIRATGMRHLLEHKSSKSKRNKRGTSTLSPSDIDKVKQCLPGM
jgi:large subunit ribosomal protein L35